MIEQVSEHAKDDSQFKVVSEYPKAKYSLFAGEEVQPGLTVDMERAATLKEELQTKPRSPLTILSEDEGYLLEDEQQVIMTEPSTEAFEDFPASRTKSAKSKRKKKKSVTASRKPRTRPTNKLRWNMKKTA